MSILKAASSFSQYNVRDMDWVSEGSATSPARNFMRRNINLKSDEVKGIKVLDAGCGIGWFLEECLKMGASQVYGLEPSNLAELATSLVPDATIIKQTFEQYDSDTKFGLISFIMSTEHMPDMSFVLLKAAGLLSDGGEILILAGDFDRFQQSNHGNVVTKEIIKPGKEVAVNIKRPRGYGTTNDVLRTVDYWKELFKKAGLKLISHKPARIDEEYAVEEPKRKDHLGHTVFHIFRLQGI